MSDRARPRRIFLSALAILLLLAGGALLARAFAQAQTAAAVRLAVPTGIDDLTPVELGGLPQWISIRGRDRGKPVLLFLHGGPGFPQLPFVENNALLEQEFVVVQWDERGTGKTFDPATPTASMNLAQLVADAHQLTQTLRSRFGGRPIFLCAHSFGTLVGALLVQQHPEDFRAYVGISQIGEMIRAETQLYDFALDYAGKNGETKSAQELRALGPPPHQGKEPLQRVEKSSHQFANDIFPQMRPNDILPRACLSPQYSLGDCLRLLRGVRFSSENLWREAYRTSLFERVPRPEVPVYFLAGRHDYAVTATVAHDYFEALVAPRGKQFIWFEKSSHFPNFEEPEKFREVMTKIARDTDQPPRAGRGVHPIPVAATYLEGMHRPILLRHAGLLLLCAGLLLPTFSQGKEKPLSVNFPAGINHQRWQELLKKYVNEQGLVDYAGWKANGADMKGLDEYLGQFAPQPAKSAEGDERMAGAINAYNACAIHWILEKYPTESIQEFSDSFTGKRYQIGGQQVSLDDLEQGTVRPEMSWRTHAVLVCCARSCPPLQRFAYRGGKLDEQVETAYQAWLARPDLNKYLPNEKKVKISSIFKWFKEDFDTLGGVKKLLARYAPESDRAFLKAGNYEVEYLPYNWGLNDQGGKGKDYGRFDLIWDKITGTFSSDEGKK